MLFLKILLRIIKYFGEMERGEGRKGNFFSESFFDFSKLDKKNVQNRESEKKGRKKISSLP
jgi:hypothetical protein